MSLLDFFSKYSFARYYVDKYLRGTPKIFLYSKKDLVLGPPLKKGTLAKAYNTMIGPTSIVNQPYEGMGHLMVRAEASFRKRSYIASSPRMQNDVVNFLKKHLVPGVRPWREVV